MNSLVGGRSELVMSQLTLLVASGFVIGAALFASTLGEYFIANVPSQLNRLGWGAIVQFALLSAGMLLFWRFGPSSQTLWHYRSLLVLAVAIRLLLFFSEPYLSNDIDRYLSDGYVAYSGLDPWSVNHLDPRIAESIQVWNPPSEHLKYTTIYPPLAITLFSFAAAFGPEYAPFVWRVIILIVSLSILALTVLILKKANRLQHLALVAFSPVLVIEAHVGLHLDVFLALSACLFLYALQRQLWVIAGLALGLGTSIKLLPIVLLVPLVVHKKYWQQGMHIASSAVLFVTLVYILTFLLGYQPLGSIGVFFEKFRFASLYYFLFEPVLGTSSMLIISALGLTIGFLLIAWRSWQINTDLFSQEFMFLMQLSLSLPILLSPVSYPWYFSVLIPFICLYPKPYLLAWVTLMPLTYEVLGQFKCCGIWQPAQWPMWLVLLGVFSSALYEKLMMIKNKTRQTSSAEKLGHAITH